MKTNSTNVITGADLAHLEKHLSSIREMLQGFSDMIAALAQQVERTQRICKAAKNKNSKCNVVGPKPRRAEIGPVDANEHSIKEKPGPPPSPA